MNSPFYRKNFANKTPRLSLCLWAKPPNMRSGCGIDMKVLSTPMATLLIKQIICLGLFFNGMVVLVLKPLKTGMA
ncbi:uncharacterized protein TOL2_C39320 [Desulfobacula toluolica Tol2]|uniref:Uncharacterized protein n=1 Tax=Desulfobacula toluolica (strain DSM 7467 / Tol2) TaxID=651182 RepID=K0NPN4_DESTT|nr:uncharacterized protein TOL2_C39320 [Desulfobacula toluolica Tol2]